MGRYIDENLANDEKLIYETRFHWIVFRWTVFWLIVFFPLGIILGVYNFIKRKSSEFAVTDKRTLIKVGVFETRTLETQLNKISNIAVNQGIFGRWLNYGTIIIASSGGIREVYKCIESPIEFKKKIQEYIEQH